ncbi:Hypothetical protein HVR_LOCUS1228 [uncultured virus]|nr:Hypothetical protein HVR_LOCUS1228 [uncultured virus]
MSESLVKPTSFSDEQQFNPNSTPEVDYNIVPAVPAGKTIILEPVVTTEAAASTIKVTTEATGPAIGPSCEIHAPPWPSIIIGILGAVVVIYTAVAPGVATDRRVFGIVIMALWTIVWALILWVLWKECHRAESWWLLLIPVIIMAIFFVLIIILNVGAP